MMNVKLRPAPTRVNAILGCPYVMVRNGYFIPIFFSVNKWNRFQATSRLQKKLVWLSCGGGGGVARGVYVAHGLHTRVVSLNIILIDRIDELTPQKVTVI